MHSQLWNRDKKLSCHMVLSKFYHGCNSIKTSPFLINKQQKAVAVVFSSVAITQWRQSWKAESREWCPGANRRHLAWNLHFGPWGPNGISILSIIWVTSSMRWCCTGLKVTFTVYFLGCWGWHDYSIRNWNVLTNLMVHELWGEVGNGVCPPMGTYSCL